MTKPRQGPVP